MDLPAPVDDREEQSEPGHGTCSVTDVALNILNCTVGSGILGLPFAINEMGFWLGIIGTTLSAVLTSFSLNMIVYTANRAGVYEYAPLAKKTTGRWGSNLLNFAIIFNGFGSMVSYQIIIADILPVLAMMYTPASGLFLSRNILLSLCAVLFIFPLLSFRNIGALAKASFFAALCLPAILITVAVRAPSYAKQHDQPMTFAGTNVFGALGIISFAFVSAQTSLMNYTALKDSSDVRWFKATTMSTGLAFVVSLAFGLIGYLSFGVDATPNIFAAFPADDHWINFSRLIMAISLIFTYPMQAYPARSSIHQVLGHQTSIRKPTVTQHWAVTVAIFLATLAVALVTSNLGRVYEIVGAFCASTMAYILPGSMYLAFFWIPYLRARVSHNRRGANSDETQRLISRLSSSSSTESTATHAHRRHSRPDTPIMMDAAAALLVVFGVVALVAGTGQTIAEIAKDLIE